MRQVLGTAMFFGMAGVTVFGLLFTPVFYIVVRRLFSGRKWAVTPRATSDASTAPRDLPAGGHPAE